VDQYVGLGSRVEVGKANKCVSVACVVGEASESRGGGGDGWLVVDGG
jgi:hypothetical protein